MPEEQLELLRKIYDKKPCEFIDQSFSGWINIQSKKQAPEKYRDNVHRFTMLRNITFPRKKYQAAQNLNDENYNIYVEKGQAKVFIKYDGNSITDIQGNIDRRIPIKYLDIIKKHFQKNNLNLSEDVQEKLKKAEVLNIHLEKIKNEIGKDAIKDGNPEKILPYFGIDVLKDKSGNLTISCYHQPSNEYTFEDLEIDENKMFENITKISGDAVFSNSQLTSIAQCKSIDGLADFRNSLITDLNKLKFIGKDAIFADSKVKYLGDLESVGTLKKDSIIFIYNSNFNIYDFKNINDIKILDVPYFLN